MSNWPSFFVTAAIMVFGVSPPRALPAGRPGADLEPPAVHGGVAAGHEPLLHPGHVCAIPPTPQRRAGWLLIDDSGNNRVIIADYPDEQGHARLVTVCGGAGEGFADGAAAAARFLNPQGLTYDRGRDRVYVADTGNHAIRAIDLPAGGVRTLVGNGRESSDRAGGRAGAEQSLSSPMDVAVSPDGEMLYVAMAGAHQIWSVETTSGVARALAGAGGAGQADGPAGHVTFARPAGLMLSTSGKSLFIADAGGSSVRMFVPADGSVRTLIGSDLLEPGDVDGIYPDARVSHTAGLAVFPGPMGDRLFISDTGNDKVKVLDIDKRKIQHWAGVPDDAEALADAIRLKEPTGLSLALADPTKPESARLFVADTGHNRVLMIDALSVRGGRGKWREVVVEGLEKPTTKTIGKP